jgi:hypothetical protein
MRQLAFEDKKYRLIGAARYNVKTRPIQGKP